MARVGVKAGFLAFLLAAPEAAAAQAPTVLDSGRIVRAHLAAGAALRGRLLSDYAPGAAQIRFCLYPANPCTATTGTERTIDVPSLSGLDVQAGSGLKVGAGVGVGLGIALGLLVHAFAEGICDTDSCVPSYPVAIVPPALFFGALGAMIGSTHISWRSVPLPAPSRGVLPN
jgi:hypothetical protein